MIQTIYISYYVELLPYKSLRCRLLYYDINKYKSVEIMSTQIIIVFVTLKLLI